MGNDMRTTVSDRKTDHLAAIAARLGEALEQADRFDEAVAELAVRIDRIESVLAGISGAAGAVIPPANGLADVLTGPNESPGEGRGSRATVIPGT